MKKKHILFSLCAITPLLLNAEKTNLIFEKEESAGASGHENLENPQGFDALYSILEPLEAKDEIVKEETVSLETVDLADAKQPDSRQNGYEREGSSKDTMCPQDPTMCMPDIQPYQINFRHTERKGIGYNKGYTTLEGFFTFSRSKYIPFLDLRGHVFNDGRLAANIGIGTRYVLNPSISMIGINAYYDYRKLKNSHFNQCGLGLEGFYNRWELRINGYLPVGEKRVVSDHHLNWISFKNFQGNNLFINENYTDKIISSKKGGDLEVGVHPFKIMRDYDCFIAAGPYYFGGDGKSAWGGKARLKVEVAKYLYVELSDSYDRLFGNRFQGTFTLTLPFGGKKCYPKKSRNAGKSDCFADNIMAWRGVQPVERQEIIVVKKQTKTYTVDPIAINPATKQPIFITFVNNGVASNNTGTFENPYTTLTSAQANTGEGSVIYVVGTPAPYTDSSWTLQNNQRFLGSAAAHNFNTTKGLVSVPIQTNLYPLISVPGFAAVTSGGLGLAFVKNVEVSGISAQQQSSQPGIFIRAQDVVVTNNYVFAITENHASIAIRGTGNVLIDSNIVTQNNTLNTAIAFTKEGLSAPNVNANVTASNNVTSGSNIGFSVEAASTGMQTLTVTGNMAANASGALDTGSGIVFDGVLNPNITTVAIVNSNTMMNNVGDGLVIRRYANARFNVFGNTSINNGGSGMSLNASPGVNTCLNIHDNISNGNPTAGYNFTNTGGTIFTEPFVNDVGSFIIPAGSIIPVSPCSCRFCPINTD